MKQTGFCYFLYGKMPSKLAKKGKRFSTSFLRDGRRTFLLAAKKKKMSPLKKKTGEDKDHFTHMHLQILSLSVDNAGAC